MREPKAKASNNGEVISGNSIVHNSIKTDCKKIKNSIDSLDAYLIHALKNPTKKLDTRDSLISKLAKKPKISDESMKELILLEKNKNYFVVIRNILRFTDLIVGFPVLKDSLMKYLKESLCRHEIIIKLNLEKSILNIESSLSLDQCFKKIRLLTVSDLTSDYLTKIKPKDWNNYLATLSLVLAEWYAKTRGMSSSQLIDLLYSSVWSHSLKKSDQRSLVNNLLDSTNFELLASAINFYQQKALDATHRLLKVESQLAEIVSINQNLHSCLDDRNAIVEKLQSNLSDLNESHIKAVNSYEVEYQTLSINLKNQLEDLRVRNLRLLQTSIELLDDGLIALSRSEPKINVMKDHAQRVLVGLKAELDRLKDIEK